MSIYRKKEEISKYLLRASHWFNRDRFGGDSILSFFRYDRALTAQLLNYKNKISAVDV